MDRVSLIRYRFDSLQQLAKHLHVVDNAALLFVRDHKKDHPPKGRVLLELEVVEPGHRTVVRAEVVARAEGTLTGSWLQLSDVRLARRLREMSQFAARLDGRVSADQVVQLRGNDGRQVVVQLLDISVGGMRVRGALGSLAGQDCAVRVLGVPAISAELGTARVVRIEAQEAGLRFADSGNPQVARYIESLQKEWARATEIDHLPGCCSLRGPIEPSLPKVRHALH